MGESKVRNSELAHLRQLLITLELSNLSTPVSGKTTSKPQRAESASRGVKVWPLPVPNNLKNEISFFFFSR